LDKEITLIWQDDEASVTKGLAVAQTLSSIQGISAVIGYWNSRVSVPASAVYEKAEVVMITPDSTTPELTAKGYNCLFRHIPSDTIIGLSHF
jgi:branched-chain amino acid transport system substrate-binding protein